MSALVGPDLGGPASSGAANNVVDDFSSIRADAKASAQKKAQAALHEQNESEWTCELEVVGDPTMSAGSTFSVSGYGVYSGTYMAKSVTHTLSGDNYTTSISGYKVLGY